MGQTLFAPPSVKGWDGQLSWINSALFFERVNTASVLSDGRGQQFKFDLAGTLTTNKLDSTEKTVDYYLNSLLDGQFQPEVKGAIVDYVNSNGAINFADLKGNANKAKTGDAKLRGAVHLILSSPDYMLK
jgi:hypothetical protein